METQTPKEPLTEERIRYMMRQIEMKCKNIQITLGIMKSTNVPIDFNIFGSILTKTERSFPVTITGNDFTDMVNKLIKFLESI